MKHALAVLLVVFLLPACSGRSISTDYAEGVDFTQFTTFQYVDKGNSLAVANPLTHTRIIESLRRGMVASGLTEAGADVDPDLYVAYYGSTNQSISFNTTSVGYGWGASSWHRGHRSTIGVSTTQTTTTHGNLLIDIWDGKRGELVWRSQLSDTLSGNAYRDADRINSAIEEALWEFPPR